MKSEQEKMRKKTPLKRSIVTGWRWRLIQVSSIQPAFTGNHSGEGIIGNNRGIEISKLGVLADEFEFYGTG